jgi:hypothetical protein
MHTTEINDTVFIHHGGFEGDVEIIRGEQRMTVPVDDVKEFIARLVCGLRVERLEDADADEILGIPKP